MQSLKMKTLKTAALLGAMSLMGAAQATSAFEGRAANGAVDLTCTATGASKCAMFYNATLDLTILNDWNIGTGVWSATADAGSAQALAEAAGASQTNFKGWSLPTGGNQPAGSANQFLSIWNDAGGSFDYLSAQFDGVQRQRYWSSSFAFSGSAYIFHAGGGWYNHDVMYSKNYTLAVRTGDVALAVPEPQTYALMLAGLGLMGFAARRRSSKQQ
ncbi:PEPxxWA-CTERM sorting domain-containing protein [Paucibacter sp. TC2R-5]|uniref:PEP-CTERM sorting domain-containing protein n=1 Tax=Paucibacter sp. TC2R-5 TaxID=2893555 RepID=UPI0021E4F531|nr:PEP-CTERM sorting domain-containing protein [Paucibacter sp. TC2R-5]MCV2360000.1 PEPxxWA-CTERM sorting domain-containing protein [Paucibacter sp. TC2R-5]